ncbi:MAG: hypothetical protein JSS82_20485 [Bacteroidetes bacterium]|nr:hypothetical protein [Bacteroidota bacterium]
MPIPPEVISQLEAERRLLEDEVFRKQSRIKEITEFINHSKKLNINWSEKAMNCLRGADEPLSTDEILRCVMRGDLAELEDYGRRRNYVMKLSLVLNRLFTKNIVVRKSIEGYKGFIYYLAEWENEDGTLKPEKLYYYNLKVEKLKIEKQRTEYA